MIHWYGIFDVDAAEPQHYLGSAAIRTYVRESSARRHLERLDAEAGYVVRRLAEPRYLESPRQRAPLGPRWVDLGCDANWQDHGGVWGRPVAGSNDLKWWIISFESTREWGDGPVEGGKYNGELSEVDLTGPADQRKGALSYIGADDRDEPVSEAELAYALHAYGAKAPIDSEQGNAVWKIVDSLRKLARDLEQDEQRYERLMDRPVNAIGSTAREFQSGDIQSAILRGVSEGDPKAELMLRLGMGRRAE